MKAYKFFKNLDKNIVGYIISIEKDHIIYIRDSMTRWTANSIPNIKNITFEEFCDCVRKNAKESGVINVNNDEIQFALEHFEKDIDCDFKEIERILA